MPLDRGAVRRLLEAFDLRTLFVEELGWDHGGVATSVHVGGKTFRLEAIAQKRGFVAYRCVSAGQFIPDYRHGRRSGGRPPRPPTNT